MKYVQLHAQNRKKKKFNKMVFLIYSLFDRVAFVMKKHLNTHLLGKHGVGTPKER